MLKRYFEKNKIEAGVDEAGRGCLAGPVYAAAVVLNPNKRKKWYTQLNDSKKLTAEQRNYLRKAIEDDAEAWSIGVADHLEIDNINILNASFLAMHRALDALKLLPELLLIDGNRFKKYADRQHKCIIDGDSKYSAIAAASILAKTWRDEYMLKLHEEFPDYGWNKNKAYATLQHRNAIEAYGLTSYHRKTFRMLPDLFSEVPDEINIAL